MCFQSGSFLQKSVVSLGVITFNFFLSYYSSNESANNKLMKFAVTCIFSIWVLYCCITNAKTGYIRFVSHSFSNSKKRRFITFIDANLNMI